MVMSEDTVRASNEWLAHLRVRFLEIARKRVEGDAVEDVVQEALVIVHEKAGAAPSPDHPGPSLLWALQVLRNVIGNHYQRARTRARASNPGSAEHDRVASAYARRSMPTPLEALERNETVRLMEEAMQGLRATDPVCEELLRALVAEELPPAETRRPGRGRGEKGRRTSAEYVRAFRCRRKLRALLIGMGVEP